MTVSAAIRQMLAAGLTIDQALIAAEAFEAQVAAEAYRRDLGVSAREWSSLRSAVFERDQYTCRYCGKDVSDAPQCDHVIPLAAGGSSELGNLVTACKSCNSGKRDRQL